MYRCIIRNSFWQGIRGEGNNGCASRIFGGWLSFREAVHLRNRSCKRLVYIVDNMSITFDRLFCYVERWRHDVSVSFVEQRQEEERGRNDNYSLERASFLCGENTGAGWKEEKKILSSSSSGNFDPISSSPSLQVCKFRSLLRGSWIKGNKDSFLSRHPAVHRFHLFSHRWKPVIDDISAQ